MMVACEHTLYFFVVVNVGNISKLKFKLANYKGNRMEIEIGIPYEFTIQSRAQRVIIVRGTRARDDGQTVVLVNVDGVDGEYGSLQDAIGESYTNVSRAKQHN